MVELLKEARYGFHTANLQVAAYAVKIAAQRYALKAADFDEVLRMRADELGSAVLTLDVLVKEGWAEVEASHAARLC